jgi:hypothetical protein
MWCRWAVPAWPPLPLVRPGSVKPGNEEAADPGRWATGRATPGSSPIRPAFGISLFGAERPRSGISAKDSFAVSSGTHHLLRTYWRGRLVAVLASLPGGQEVPDLTRGGRGVASRLLQCPGAPREVRGHSIAGMDFLAVSARGERNSVPTYINFGVRISGPV